MKVEYKPYVDALIDLAIREDIGDGDHTSLCCIPAGERGRMRLLCKQEGIIAGIEIARIVFERLDPTVEFDQRIEDGTRVKPVVTLNGEKSAQVMLICGADNGGNLPNFRQNLRFAAAWEARMEALFPGLTRPVLFDYRYYNQDLTTGSLLIEVGGHANTLDEAKRAGRMAAQALAALLAAP